MFPLMGFDIKNHKAIIYDDGTENFTGTTLSGIGQSILGVLQHQDETANRFVKVLSIKTCQNELLEAFEKATPREKWDVSRNTTQALKKSGEAKFETGDKGWILDLVVAQLFDKGEGRCVVAPSWEDSDSPSLGVKAETADEIVAKIVKV